MQETLRMMKQLITKGSNQYTLEELSEKYQVDRNPIYLATAFNQLYKLAIDRSQKYYMLNEQDIASHTLDRLDYCLINFDIEQEVKFSTYFATILSNKFREVAQSLMAHKRKTVFVSASYEELVELGYDEGRNQDLTISQVCDNLQGLLDDDEILYCKYLMQDYTNQEISDIMGISIMTLSNWRKKLKRKLEIAL